MEKSIKIIKDCHFCGENATSLCFECLEYFCDNCFKIIHSLKKTLNHKKEKIDLYAPIDLKCPEHSNIPINLFCIDEKELCCSQCVFESQHQSHKILMLNDIESLNKENITIESSTLEFNEIIKKTISLKNNIEKEINDINKLYEKVIDDLTKSYLKKHEQLLKEENNLKEKLQNEVTKIKEQLEKYWSKSNNEIKLSEKLNNGITKLKNEENNMVKNLNYISKLNKNQKEMQKLFQIPMKSLKFNYMEEKNNIEYEEYYFNGLPIPNNIEFKDITSNSLNLYWKIDNINLINIDKKNIKYQVEMREKDEYKFKKVYIGENKNYFINNLKENTYYEFIICTLYNDLIGSYTEIQKIKTYISDFNIDSIILNESERKSEFSEKIEEWIGYKKLELLFRGSRDGMTSKIFHDKCDNKGETLTLCKNEKGYIFGGYASIPWKSIGDWVKAKNCFVFTLTNIHNTEPNIFRSINNEEEIYFSSDYGPNFFDFGLYSDFKYFSNFPYFYKDILGKGKSIFTGDLNNKNKKFQIKEIEVFKLY